MNQYTVGADLIKRAGKGMKFNSDPARITELAGGLVPTGFGQSMLAMNDRVQAINGLVEIESTVKSQAEPIKYLAISVTVQNNVEKIVAVSSLLRRKVGATVNHGIFAEDAFTKAITVEDFYNTLIANPGFTVSNVLRNQEFPFGKASVYETVR